MACMQCKFICMIFSIYKLTVLVQSNQNDGVDNWLETMVLLKPALIVRFPILAWVGNLAVTDSPHQIKSLTYLVVFYEWMPF